MLKVKIDGDWVENVYVIHHLKHANKDIVCYYKDDEEWVIKGKIQDVKWVEDECEHHWFDEDGTQVCSRCGKTIIQVQNEQDEPEEIERLKMAVMNEGEMLIQDKLNEVIEAINQLRREQ